MSKKRRISLSISPELLALLNEYCKKEKRSLSNAAEIAIEELLKNQAPATEGRR